MKRLPASMAARRSCSRMPRSPFGSITTAPMPVLDRTDRNPGLRDRLARAGGADDERVRASTHRRTGSTPCGGCRHGRFKRAIALPADAPRRPRTYSPSPGESERRRSSGRWRRAGDVCQVGAGVDVFVVPAAPADGCEQGRDRQCRASAADVGPRQDKRCQRDGRPGPVQVPAAHQPRRQRAQHQAGGEVQARRQRPVMNCQRSPEGRPRLREMLREMLRMASEPLPSGSAAMAGPLGPQPAGRGC